jgi:hypothetical protein
MIRNPDLILFQNMLGRISQQNGGHEKQWCAAAINASSKNAVVVSLGNLRSS